MDKELQEYYEELNTLISFMPIYKSLQSKFDYGNHISEMPYQLSARTLAGRLARVLNAYEDKAEVLTCLSSCYFPVYGEAGKKVLHQYLEDKGILISDEDLARTIIEYQIDECHIQITKELDNELKDVFAKVPAKNISLEAEIARFVQDIIKKVKMIERFSQMNEDKFIYHINLEIIEATKQNERLTSSPRLEKLYQNTIIKDIPLPQEIKAQMIQSIDHLNENNPITSVCKYTALKQIKKRC